MLSFDALAQLMLLDADLSDADWQKNTLKKLLVLQDERRCALQAGIHVQHSRWHLLRALQEQAVLEKKLRAPVLFFAQGMHPWWIQNSPLPCLYETHSSGSNSTGSNSSGQGLQILEEELRFCHAVGECGLDKNAAADFAQQKELFAQQLNLAVKMNLPVVAHVVSWPEVAAQLMQKSGALGMVHGFTGSLETLQNFLQLGWYIGFGHRLLTSKKAQKAAVVVPASRLLLESDGHGKFAETAAFLAQLRGVSEAEILRSTLENARLLFQV